MLRPLSLELLTTGRAEQAQTTAGLAKTRAIARSVHSTDGYPPYMPDDDFLAFLDSSEALAAWVDVADSQVVGHNSLHSGSSREVMVLAAEALGIDAGGIGVVARLLVDPDRRRLGAGSALLVRATSEAVDRGLVPILDVVDRFTAAIALYEQEGWTRLGTVTVVLPDGSTMNEHVYTGPTNAAISR